jgi:hypothetical protein
MPGALTLVLAAALVTLPPLPQRGLALETRAGVQLQTMSGRPLGTLPGLDLALDQAAAHVVMLRSRRGPLYAFDGHRLRPRASRPVGHWIWSGALAGRQGDPCAVVGRVRDPGRLPDREREASQGRRRDGGARLVAA